MELVIKSFEELSKEELLEIFQLRIAVFVVEQNCPYQDITEVDKLCYHIYLREGTRIVGYARVLPKGATFEEASIGRVISTKRRCGVGSKIVATAIAVAKEKFSARVLMIEAQTYARKLYENHGFIQVSEEFLEDGLPHIKMKLDLA